MRKRTGNGRGTEKARGTEEGRRGTGTGRGTGEGRGDVPCDPAMSGQHVISALSACSIASNGLTPSFCLVESSSISIVTCLFSFMLARGRTGERTGDIQNAMP